MAYTWNNQWIWKYESIWCSLEKFKYSNELTSKDLGVILRASRERVQTESVYKSLYLSKNIVDISSLSNLLNIDVFNKLDNDLNLFLDALYNNLNIEKYIVYKLRYCPKCIEVGYHSIFHQLSFFDDCVFHNTKLKSKCPICKKEEPYLIKYSKSKHGFSCECGYSYISETNTFNLFNLWLSNTYTKDIQGFKLNHSNLIYTSFNWYKKKKLFQDKCYIENRNNMYSLLKNNSIDNLPKIEFNHSNSLKSNSNTKNNITKPMIHSYINILKSISRHIRRHYIKENRIDYFYVRSNMFLDPDFNYKYHTGYTYSEIEPELYAYIMWRKEMEGHEEFSTVHKRLKFKGINDISQIPQNIMNTKVYKYIDNEFSEYIINQNYRKEIIFDNCNIIKDSLDRIIGIILWSNFINWLDYANYKKQNCPYDKIDFSASIPLDIDDFFIGYDNKSDFGYVIKIK